MNSLSIVYMHTGHQRKEKRLFQEICTTNRYREGETSCTILHSFSLPFKGMKRFEFLGNRYSVAWMLWMPVKWSYKSVCVKIIVFNKVHCVKLCTVIALFKKFFVVQACQRWTPLRTKKWVKYLLHLVKVVDTNAFSMYKSFERKQNENHDERLRPGWYEYEWMKLQALSV